MTTDSTSNIPTVDPVTLLGTAFLKPASNTGKQYVAPAFAAEHTDTIILISFDASKYPLEEHCRYAVRRDESRPYTFPNFQFQQQPPGLRVGPWPGWRSIPPMPSAKLKAGETEYELQFQFWGDELHRHILRAVVKISSFRSEQIVVSIVDPQAGSARSAVLRSSSSQAFAVPVRHSGREATKPPAAVDP